MADIGYARSLLAGIPDERTRRILIQVFEHTYSNLRFGVPDPQTRAENFQAHYQNSTTPSTASDGFSFAHGMASTPRLAIPCVDLTSSGGQIVPLVVDRPADGKRVYLRSTSTRASFVMLVE